MSMLADIGSSLRSFFVELTSALGFDLLFALALVIEIFFVALFVVRAFYSYEMRLRRSIDKANAWLFENKKIDQSNIKEFNDIIKKGPKRLVYFWQQFILFREKEPTYYLSSENLIEKPLKTSSFEANIKNLNIVTAIWTSVVFLLCIAFQGTTATGVGTALTIGGFVGALITPLLILIIGLIAAMILKAKKISNLDEIYHIYHIFARFINNACVDLPPYIDYDLLFSPKEIEKSNPQLREYYEARARKAKEEFEKAKQSDVEYVEYKFEDAGVDGSLVLERAMKESENFMNKKSSTLAKIAHVEAQQEALKRNYENVQKDLQRKIQASKENIQKLIQQQEATTNRMEVGFLRKQQEQEISKQESLQNEYDQEETRYAVSNEELNQEKAGLRQQLEQAKDDVQKAMVNEYQSFYEKIMKNAYKDAEDRVTKEKNELKKEKDNREKELIIVQTQVKRLIDENDTLRARLGEQNQAQQAEGQQQKGEYDANGNYVYEDGSYHDPNGLFHDVDGKIYDMNGTLIREPEDDKKSAQQENEPAKVAEETPVDQETPVATEPEKETQAEKEAAQETPAQPEQPAEQEKTDDKKTEESAAKKRGRPKKPATESESKEPKKRGRPKKTTSVYEKSAKLSEKDGAPAQTKKRPTSKTKKPTTTQAKPTTKSAAKTTSTTRTPKKATSTTGAAKKTTSTTSTAKKKTSTAKKPAKKTSSTSKAKTSASKNLDLVSLAKMNKMITDEEEKLNRMKAIVNSEISDALNQNQAQEIADEREEIVKAVEELRQRAQKAKAEGKSEEELASINSRLESLINEISKLNK